MKRNSTSGAFLGLAIAALILIIISIGIAIGLCFWMHSFWPAVPLVIYLAWCFILGRD